MKKTMIAPGIGQVANSQKKENKNTPAWVKKIKSTEVGAFALGLAAYNLLFVKIKNGLPFFEAEETIIETESSEIPTQETVNGIIEENAQVATTVTDDMSFGEAFQASREELGPGNFFWWKGRFYNNYQEEEWNNLTEAEQAAFVQQAGNFDEEDMAMDDTMETETTSDADSRVTVEEPAEHPAETLEDNQFSEQHNQQQMEYLDTNNDGKDDSLLINMDDDQQAEVVQTWVDGVNYALVDTGNTGMLDTIWMIDEEGNPYDPMPLAEEIPAPKLSREQHLDLLGNDGVIDSLAIDNRGDDRADQVFVDMNSDGTYDVAYFDTDGDGNLDTASKMEDGQFTEAFTLNEPFESPMVSSIAETMSAGTQQNQTIPGDNDVIPADGSSDAQTEQPEEIEGLDNDADVGEFF